MKILVTGAAGFIGSNFVFHMLKEHPDYDIVGLDSLTYAGNLETLAPVIDEPHFKFVKADITDAEAIDKLFAEEKETLSTGQLGCERAAEVPAASQHRAHTLCTHSCFCSEHTCLSSLAGEITSALCPSLRPSCVPPTINHSNHPGHLQ